MYRYEYKAGGNIAFPSALYYTNIAKCFLKTDLTNEKFEKNGVCIYE